MIEKTRRGTGQRATRKMTQAEAKIGLERLIRSLDRKIRAEFRSLSAMPSFEKRLDGAKMATLKYLKSGTQFFEYGYFGYRLGKKLIDAAEKEGRADAWLIATTKNGFLHETMTVALSNAMVMRGLNLAVAGSLHEAFGRNSKVDVDLFPLRSV